MNTGAVVALHRYPIKSMQGEAVTSVDVTPSGIVGDRALALLDVATGRIASAHHPTKWGRLLQCAARWSGTPHHGTVFATLPDGREIPAGPALEEALSELLQRAVRLIRQAPEAGYYEIVHPEVQDSAPDEFVAQTLHAAGAADGRTGHLRVSLDAPAGSLLDCAPLHLITTNALRALTALGNSADDLRRYRPNIVIEEHGPDDGLPEPDRSGQHVRIGELEAVVTIPTPRCIMPTLEQRGIPASTEPLAALTKWNRLTIGRHRWACLGWYAKPVSAATVSVTDAVAIPA